MAKSPILSICYVTSPRFKTDKTTGAVTPDGNNIYYFKSSGIYAADDVSTVTGVNAISNTNWSGQEPIVKIEELIHSRKVYSVNVLVENAVEGKPNKPVRVFIAPDKVATIGNSDATGLVGKTLKTIKKGSVVTIGKVLRIVGKTRDIYK